MEMVAIIHKLKTLVSKRTILIFTSSSTLGVGVVPTFTLCVNTTLNGSYIVIASIGVTTDLLEFFLEHSDFPLHASTLFLVHN